MCIFQSHVLSHCVSYRNFPEVWTKEKKKNPGLNSTWKVSLTIQVPVNPSLPTCTVKEIFLYDPLLLLFAFSVPPEGSAVKNPPSNGDEGLIPGSEWSPGDGNGNPLQSFCLENHVDRGDWQASFHGVTRVRHAWATEQTRTSVFLLL